MEPIVVGGIAGAALGIAVVALRQARLARREARAAAEVAPAPTAPPDPVDLPARADATRALELVEALRRRLDLVEERSAAVSERLATIEGERPAPPAPAAARPRVDPAARVREHVRTLGYEDVEVVPADAGDRTFAVEARRHGMTVKGRAEVDADGRVQVRVSDARRAFP
jgi:hypothetical protein